MINIPYTCGEFNIEIFSWIRNRDIPSTRKLVKDVISISPQRYEIKKEIETICDELIAYDETKAIDKGAKKKDVEHHIKKCKRFKEYLEQYIK